MIPFLNKYYFDKHKLFQLNELSHVFENIFNAEQLSHNDNPQIITLNSDLQTLFKTEFIFLPELDQHLLPFVTLCHKDSVKENISDVITQEINTLTTKTDLIYQDPTSQFYLEENLRLLLDKNKHITYTWTDIIKLFQQYIAKHPEMIVKTNTKLIFFPKSKLASILGVHVLHQEQLDILLKEFTLFIGRDTTLNTLCPYLNLENKMSTQCSLWLEHFINKDQLPTVFNQRPYFLFHNHSPSSYSKHIQFINT